MGALRVRNAQMVLSAVSLPEPFFHTCDEHLIKPFRRNLGILLKMIKFKVVMTNQLELIILTDNLSKLLFVVMLVFYGKHAFSSV